MFTRRDLLIRASVSLVCAPAIVRAQNLMPLRGFILPIERHHFGFVERVYVDLNLRKILRLQSAGMSAHQIAGELNRGGYRDVNGTLWDAGGVLGIIKHDRLIRSEDLYLRAERLMSPFR